MGATRFQTLIHLKIPAGMPGILAGLRVSVVLAVVGAVVGEFIGGSEGLGALIIASQGDDGHTAYVCHFNSINGFWNDSLSNRFLV